MTENQYIILLNVVIASVLAGVIGFEREKVDKPAGLRTNMLVGGAVALLTMMGKIITMSFQESELAEYTDADPTRIIQAIIVGISFIGAGMVLQIEAKQRIKYLTSAATILFTSGISIAVALHQYILAVGATLFVLFINFVLAKLGKLFNKN